MRYACLIYFDPKKVFNQSAEAESVLRDSMDPQNEIRSGGHVISEAALMLPDQAITLQMRDGKMSTTDGPFMETKEVLGGIVVIEAKDLNEALRVGATIPLARIGSVEVRPFVDFSKPRPRL
ncbi:MAG: YciI family protein [Myxococcales bacterium]